MVFGRDDQAPHEERKADEEHREDTSAVKVSEHVNDFGGVHDQEADGEASVFRALADPTRRRILQDLRDGEMAAGDIASRFPIKGPSV
jgi:hypothetical protein